MLLRFCLWNWPAAAWLFDDFDTVRKKLDQLIQKLNANGKVLWEPMKELEDGSYQLGYLQYPEEVFDIFELLEQGENYRSRMNKRPRSRWIHHMDILQIRAQLTYLSKEERFCEGVIADAVDDGIHLKLLLRLKELLDAHKGGK